MDAKRRQLLSTRARASLNLNVSHVRRHLHASIAAVCFSLGLLFTIPAGATTSPGKGAGKEAARAAQLTTHALFDRPILRDGFHFQASFGVGVGPRILGLYHAMEIGWSVSGYSISLLHTFLQNKGVFGSTRGGPDEIGGFMLQLKGPLYFEDLSWKFASGVGGTVDQSDGFHATAGFGVHYGVDVHVPIWQKFGPTLSLDAMNIVEGGHHYFGAGLGLGFTIF